MHGQAVFSRFDPGPHLFHFQREITPVHLESSNQEQSAKHL